MNGLSGVQRVETEHELHGTNYARRVVATSHIQNAERGFLAVFSASKFPGAQIVLNWIREEGGGNVYR
jgi:hypothetical protein